MLRKSVVVLLLITLCFSIAACTQSNAPATNTESTATGSGATESGQTAQATTTDKKNEKLFENPVTLSMLYPDTSAWAYNENWFTKKTIEEEANVILDVIPVNTADYAKKVNALMASAELPDIIVHQALNLTKQYALQGAFVNMADVLDKAPNFKKWADENKEHVQKFNAGDGNLYTFPTKGVGTTNRRFWLYRKDIFDKLNLAPPTTDAELLDVLRKLKKEYPDSYPFAVRKDNQAGMIAAFGLLTTPSYNFDKKEWTYTPISDTYKQYLAFMKTLYEEKLIPPDYFSMDDKAAIDMITQGKCFITIDYIGRVSTFEQTGQANNPDYALEYMTPINQTFFCTDTDYQNITVSSGSKKIDEAVKLLDWYYTDKAIELLSWGKENVTYTVVDGKRVFKDTALRAAYGISAFGFYAVLDPQAIASVYKDSLKKGVEEQTQYEEKENPRGYLALTDEEAEVKASIDSSLSKYRAEQDAKFILGQRSLDEWDQYVGEVKAMGIDKLLQTYDKAYKRMVGEK